MELVLGVVSVMDIRTYHRYHTNNFKKEVKYDSFILR